MKGTTWATALQALQDLGMLAARVEEPVDDPALDNLILNQEPAAGEWVAPGTTIRLVVGVFSGDAGTGDG